MAWYISCSIRVEVLYSLMRNMRGLYSIHYLSELIHLQSNYLNSYSRDDALSVVARTLRGDVDSTAGEDGWRAEMSSRNE